MAALVDIGCEEGHECPGRGDGALFAVWRAVCHIHADHGVRPFQQIIGHGFGHAEQAGDDGDGQLLAKMRQQIERACGQAVHQIVAELRDFRPKRGDPARGEGAQHQTTQAGVAGGFQLQHGMRLDRVKRFQVIGDHCGQFGRGFAAKAAVAKNGVGGGGGRRADHAVVGPVKERAVGAGAAIKRVRILHKSGVCRGLVQGLHRV